MRAAVRAYRTDLAALVRLAEQDLAVLWRQASSPTEAQELMLDVLPKLVNVYGSAAASLAADWYDDLRADSDASGHFSAITAELPDQGRTDALARWGTGFLFVSEPNYDDALTLVSGGFQRIIANAGRETVMGSSVADKRARGWKREGDGGCEFCSMLIASGDLYSEEGADFECHDHCDCVAVPVFD